MAVKIVMCHDYYKNSLRLLGKRRVCVLGTKATSFPPQNNVAAQNKKLKLDFRFPASRHMCACSKPNSFNERFAGTVRAQFLRAHSLCRADIDIFDSKNNRRAASALTNRRKREIDFGLSPYAVLQVLGNNCEN